jgi:hypothetical protein
MRKFSRLISLSLVLFTISTWGCSEEESSPTETPPESLAEGELGQDGGELNSGDLVLSIPAGALETDTYLSLHEDDSDHPFAGTESVYRIEGLPEQLGTPVTLRVRNQAGRDEGAPSLLFMGEERDGTHAGRSTSWLHIASRDSVEWCIAQIERGAYNLDGRDENELQFVATNTVGYIPYEDEEHFRVYYNFMDMEPEFPFRVLEKFEETWDVYYANGFTFGDQDTIWPLQIHLAVPQFSEIAEYYTGPWGRGKFVLDPVLEEAGDNIAHVVVHELFHNAQDYFDTRHPSDWTTVNQDRVWLDEASAAYLEASIDPEWIPQGPNLDSYLAPLWGIGGHPTLVNKEYGYGMCSFIRYLAEQQGEERLLELYEAFFQSGKITTALMDVMDPPLEVWCSDFQKQVVLFQLYDFDPNGIAWHYWPFDTVFFDAAIGSSRTATLQVPDFGSDVWKGLIVGDSPPENSNLKVEILSNSDPEALTLDLVLYGRNENELPVLLSESGEELLYDNWSDLHHNYTDLMVQVIRPHGSGPDYDTQTNVEIEVSVIEEVQQEEMPAFIKGRFMMKYASLMEDGSVDPGDMLSLQYAAGTMFGNSFSAVWDSIGVYGSHLSGHFDVNLALNPMRVLSWSYERRWEFPDDPDTYKIYQAEGGALPFDFDGDSYKVFRLEEEAVCESLTHLYLIDVAGGLVQEELDEWSCNSNSYLNIYLNTIE